jgi:RimJ/RimL family protein N-acetyltransferase
LLLREQEIADAEAANAYESLDAITRLMNYPPQTLPECRAHIERIIAERASVPRRVYDFAITLRSGSPMIGRVGMAIQTDGANAAIWYVLHPDRQRVGLAAVPCLR